MLKSTIYESLHLDKSPRSGRRKAALKRDAGTAVLHRTTGMVLFFVFFAPNIPFGLTDHSPDL